MEEKDLNNLKRQIRETRQIAERNHEIVEKIYGMMWRARLFRILYWIVIIGIAVGAFYFLEPYVDQAVEVYGGLQEQINAIPGFGESS